MCFDTQDPRPVNLKLCLNLISNLAEENTCNESYYMYLFTEFGIGIRRLEIRRNGKEPVQPAYAFCRFQPRSTGRQ